MHWIILISPSSPDCFLRAAGLLMFNSSSAGNQAALKSSSIVFIDYCLHQSHLYWFSHKPSIYEAALHRIDVSSDRIVWPVVQRPVGAQYMMTQTYMNSYNSQALLNPTDLWLTSCKIQVSWGGRTVLMFCLLKHLVTQLVTELKMGSTAIPLIAVFSSSWCFLFLLSFVVLSVILFHWHDTHFA